MADGRIEIGTVLSRGFETIGRNFPAFLGLSLLLGGLPAFVFSYLSAENPGANDLLGVAAGGAPAGAWIVQALASALLEAIMIRSSIRTLSGRDADIGGGAAAVFGMILPLIGLTILTFLIMLIGLVLLIVPGIIAYVALSVVVPVMVEERRGVMECMERSAELTKGMRWHVFLLMLILGFAYLLLAMAIGGAIVAVGAEALQSWAEALAVTVTSLFMAPMTAALYIELVRVKDGGPSEGLAGIFA